MIHTLSVDQFTPEYLGQLFEVAGNMEAWMGEPEIRRDLATSHLGETLVTLFYEPSTRTRLSFEIAATKLGMGVVSTENAREFSSAAKGETIEDTIKVLNEYGPSAIVLRHHETGAAARAAAVSRVPIINAGDGKGEHPTQALLDAYTIQKRKGRLEDLNVTIGGDLTNVRTARSLAKMLALYNNNFITFVSTPEFKIGDDIKRHLDDRKINYRETYDIKDAVIGADVVYWTRLQKERLDPSQSSSEQFVIDELIMSYMLSDTLLMHPLPRVGEITAEVDNDPRAGYFEQAGNGLYVRMALLDKLAA